MASQFYIPHEKLPVDKGLNHPYLVEDDILRQWNSSVRSGCHGSAHQEINSALQKYRSADDELTKYSRAKVAASLVRIFTVRDAMAERWPLLVRQRLSQPSPNEAHSPEPFSTWARPRDLEKRTQATA